MMSDARESANRGPRGYLRGFLGRLLVRPEQHIEGRCVYCENDRLRMRIARVKLALDVPLLVNGPKARWEKCAPVIQKAADLLGEALHEWKAPDERR